MVINNMVMEKGKLLDKDIREPLFDFLEETYGKVRILEEKVTGSAQTVIEHSAVLGNAEIKLMKQRELVDFSVEWIEQNRK